MKIKTREMRYEDVMALPKAKNHKPRRPNLFFRTAVRIASAPDLWATHFRYTFPNKKEVLKTPSLILMNHSSFLDLEMVSGILYPHAYNIVCTTDGLVGKEWLMRNIGCIPTQKFVSDLRLIRKMKEALGKQRTHVLMYPEAGYSFDGKATPLPRKLGAFLKLLDVPVVMIETNGAFLRDPLYNCLQKRRVKASADCRLLLSREEIKEKSVPELDAILDEAFSFDNFARQKQEGVRITEPFRADGLERILYKCPHCLTEGKMEGKGVNLVCHACKQEYFMTELGELEAKNGDTVFSHIPDWYAWERAQVKQEIEEGKYLLDTHCRIGMLVDHKALYMVGEGRLIHDQNGFVLDGCEGKLHYEQKAKSSYSLNADYYWYEIGDVICIGNADALYYCFPEQEGVVSKTRLAAEEMYKLEKGSKE